MCQIYSNDLCGNLEYYNKSQGIVLLQVYDRAVSQNSCARTDIVLKRGSRARTKPTEKQQQLDSINPLSMNFKQEDRNLSVGRTIRSDERCFSSSFF